MICQTLLTGHDSLLIYA